MSCLSCYIVPDNEIDEVLKPPLPVGRLETVTHLNIADLGFKCGPVSVSGHKASISVEPYVQTDFPGLSAVLSVRQTESGVWRPYEYQVFYDRDLVLWTPDYGLFECFVKWYRE